ncbi:hypothetical protein Nepgr_015228 [Nepenthes gracilis]|uniref:Uncharacterized protein n=1 Tax=Nepenthes gracilis TaxID=150966 RepID=A0AAD3SLR2_NEPGR|nr:hypothetical protein Nepgr_015228 [Nepenthes gracilis]
MKDASLRKAKTLLLDSFNPLDTNVSVEEINNDLLSLEVVEGKKATGKEEEFLLDSAFKVDGDQILCFYEYWSQRDNRTNGIPSNNSFQSQDILEEHMECTTEAKLALSKIQPIKKYQHQS